MKFHIPVLLDEGIALLDLQPNHNVIDCTLGDGGDTIEILKRIAPRGRVLGIDADREAIERAELRIANYKLRDRVILVNDNFRNISEIVETYHFFPVHAVLLDLGVSSYQIDEAERGFSFKKDTPLAMTFHSEGGISAMEVVNKYPKQKLKEVLRKYGEIKQSGAIARNIVEARKSEPITTSSMLVKAALPGAQRVSGEQFSLYHIKLLAKIWQAIRIEVNGELANLEAALPQITSLLPKGGRIAVISYHSLEDRIVKQYFKEEANPCLCPKDFPECRCGRSSRLTVITKKIVCPRELETRQNPRARSAKLRVAEKI